MDSPSSVCIWAALIQFSRFFFKPISFSNVGRKMQGVCALRELEVRHGSDQIHCIHIGNLRRINTEYYIKNIFGHICEHHDSSFYVFLLL